MSYKQRVEYKENSDYQSQHIMVLNNKEVFFLMQLIQQVLRGCLNEQKSVIVTLDKPSPRCAARITDRLKEIIDIVAGSKVYGEKIE